MSLGYKGYLWKLGPNTQNHGLGYTVISIQTFETIDLIFAIIFSVSACALIKSQLKFLIDKNRVINSISMEIIHHKKLIAKI